LRLWLRLKIPAAIRDTVKTIKKCLYNPWRICVTFALRGDLVFFIKAFLFFMALYFIVVQVYVHGLGEVTTGIFVIFFVSTGLVRNLCKDQNFPHLFAKHTTNKQTAF
jgi:hypothetical protein